MIQGYKQTYIAGRNSDYIYIYLFINTISSPTDNYIHYPREHNPAKTFQLSERVTDTMTEMTYVPWYTNINIEYKTIYRIQNFQNFTE